MTISPSSSRRAIRVLTATLLALPLAITLPASGADYPDHAVRVISPFPPGGGVDSVARVITAALSEALGQPFVVENHAGASGRIGTEIAAKATPDGYTLLLGSVGPNAIVPSAYKSLPYDAVKSFAPIGQIGTTAYVLVVPAKVPVKTLDELIALAKANPDKLTFASTGNLGGPHLAGELLNVMAGIKTVHVAYKGGAPTITALLGGEVTFAFASMPTVAQHVKAGTLRVLAITSATRAPSLPDVPAIAETLKGYQVLQWYGLLAPAGTPAPIVAKLNAALVKAADSAKVKERLARVDTDAAPSTPQAFATQIASEIASYRDLIEKAGIQAE
jgi:tripartite-type tricarboxylate transporter receptor subunit TctC